MVVRTVEGVKAPVGDGGPVASGLRVAVDEKDTLTEAEGLLEAEAEEVAVAVSVAVAVVACSLRTGAPEHSCMMSNALIKRAQEGTILWRKRAAHAANCERDDSETPIPPAALEWT